MPKWAEDMRIVSATAWDALIADRDRLRDQLGLTRMCVACGAVKPADQPRHDPALGCDGVACTWDMTPQEAADHWQKLAHDRAIEIKRINDLRQKARLRAGDLEAALHRIVTPAPGVTEVAPPWVVGIAEAALKGTSDA